MISVLKKQLFVISVLKKQHDGSARPTILLLSTPYMSSWPGLHLPDQPNSTAVGINAYTPHIYEVHMYGPSDSIPPSALVLELSPAIKRAA